MFCLQLSTDELTEWVIGSLKKIDRYNADEHLRMQDGDQDGKLTWREYNMHVFGYMPAENHDPKSEYGKVR